MRRLLQSCQRERTPPPPPDGIAAPLDRTYCTRSIARFVQILSQYYNVVQAGKMRRAASVRRIRDASVAAFDVDLIPLVPISPYRTYLPDTDDPEWLLTLHVGRHYTGRWFWTLTHPPKKNQMQRLVLTPPSYTAERSSQIFKNNNTDVLTPARGHRVVHQRLKPHAIVSVRIRFQRLRPHHRPIGWKFKL